MRTVKNKPGQTQGKLFDVYKYRFEEWQPLCKLVFLQFPAGSRRARAGGGRPGHTSVLAC